MRDAKMESLPLYADFPALQLVRTGRFIRSFGKLTLVGLVLVMVAMVFVPWRQTARGTGIVMALDPQERPQAVNSPSKGVVSEVKEGLREGSYVEKGELVVRMTPFALSGVENIMAQVIATQAELEAAKSNLTLANLNVDTQLAAGESAVRSLEEDVKAAREKWQQAKNQIQIEKADLRAKENEYRIAEQSGRPGIGIIPQGEVFAKLQAYEQQKEKLAKAESFEQEMFATLTSKEEDFESKRQDIDIKNRMANQKVLEETIKLASIEKKLLEIQNKADENSRLEVFAPRSGYIQQWNGLEGSDVVKEGDQLFVIVPEATSLSVEMKVSGNDMPLINEGDPVRLQFEGWPAVQFVGWPSVAVGTFGGKVSRVFPTDDGKGFFRVVVTPDSHFDGEEGWPTNRYLRQGVRANGWVLLREVPLGYEIWRQLNGFPPIVADEEPKSDDKGSKVKLPKV